MLVVGVAGLELVYLALGQGVVCCRGAVGTCCGQRFDAGQLALKEGPFDGRLPWGAALRAGLLRGDTSAAGLVLGRHGGGRIESEEATRIGPVLSGTVTVSPGWGARKVSCPGCALSAGALEPRLERATERERERERQSKIYL